MTKSRPSKSKNRPWGIEFLARQLAALTKDLAECQKWEKGLTVPYSDDEMDTLRRDDLSDVAQALSCRQEEAIATNICGKKLKEIKMAIQNLEHDIKKPSENQQYGLCQECYPCDPPVYIKEKRLKAQPWVQVCKDCQEAREKRVA